MEEQERVLTIELLGRLRDEILTAKLRNGGSIRDVADVREWLEEQMKDLSAARRAAEN